MDNREVCGDNRFELIEKYKQRLIEATNIETSKEEMDVIDNILFRFWQMGWLDKLEFDVIPRSEVVEEVLAKVKELVKEYMLDKGLYLATLKHALNYAEKIIKGAE